MDRNKDSLRSVGKLPRRRANSVLFVYSPLAIVLVVIVVLVAVFPSKAKSSSEFTIGNAKLGMYFAEKPGYTVAGVKCAPNIRQVPWSKYAPYCEPKWTGNNGGTTSFGVTKSTITITYREPASSLSGLAALFFPPQLIGTEAQALQTMQTYIDLFNKSYELYGRRVVLKTFVGKGDELSELQGQDLEQAQQDSLSAKQLGAFADISLLASTQIYDQDLADQDIIAIGALAQPQSWFQSYAPYEYSPTSTCDQGAKVVATVIGREMANLPAIFAGDPNFVKRVRKFGLIYPENPNYAGCALELAKILSTQYNSPMTREVGYTINIAQATTQATNIVAQMKSRGVTSVICACDPLFPIFLASTATQQNYNPEWLALDFGDIFSQKVTPQSQWAHEISGGIVMPPNKDEEAYKAYKLEDPTGTPSPEFYDIYQPLLEFFAGLQAAGPDLTPYTFEHGIFSLPPSLPNGDYGAWQYGNNVFNPPADFGILRWDPNLVSPSDGLKGTMIACDNGKRFPFSTSGANQLPFHKQINCPSVQG